MIQLVDEKTVHLQILGHEQEKSVGNAGQRTARVRHKHEQVAPSVQRRVHHGRRPKAHIRPPGIFNGQVFYLNG